MGWGNGQPSLIPESIKLRTYVHTYVGEVADKLGMLLSYMDNVLLTC